MIKRGMQRMSTTPQFHDGYRPLLFDTLIQSWSGTGNSPPPITYSNGYFYIPTPQLSDYLITWFISIKTSTMEDGLGDNFSIFMSYGNGKVTEGDSSSTVLNSNIVIGFKYLHVIDIASSTNTLKLYVQSCSFYNNYYLTPTNEPAGNLLPSQISNANISIISV